VKSLTSLWNSIAKNLAMRCCTSAHHDINTVEVRSKNEGLSFLTITLPTFAKDFELCLERGYVDNTVFLSFKKNRSLPAFLSGFSCLVFDRGTGVLLDEPSVEAIQAIRQLTLLFSKILLDCSPRREARAFREFVECEKEVEASRGTRSYEQFEYIRTLLFGSIFSKIDSDIYQGNLLPKHGPGATADAKYGNQKFHQTTWPCRLEPYFPYGEMVLPNWSYWEQIGEVDFLEPGSEIPVKVISVPKTMKTPRIIAVEPTAMQYAQQAVLRLIVDTVAGEKTIHRMISFNDQTPNQRLAREGSRFRDLATLDLSEASDRVSCETVSHLLSSHRHFHDAVMACRSTRARLPDDSVRELSKFASMGSALCFPMEAAVFLVAIFVGIQEDLERRLVRSDVKHYSHRVRVFGDDIVVPKEHVRSVIRSLEYFGLKVNGRKSFWNGKFRESCGKEYYDGTDVSIVRVRRVLPESRRDVQEIISAVSLRNQLFLAGLEDTAYLLDRRMLGILRHFPVVEESSPVLGRISYSGHIPSKLIHSIPKVKGWMIRSKIPVNEIDDWPALRKCLSLMEMREGGEIATSPDHLRRSGRPRAVDIKLGWGPLGY